MNGFWQKVKDFFKKFWHFVVIGALAAAVVALVIVMCVCMVPKGSKNEQEGGGDEGGNEPPVIVAFDAPANVTVNGKTLTWSATEGATSGYTVKINDYEMLTGGTSLSLASGEVTARLNYGDNALSVRVNAVYNKQQSAYSTAVNYNYELPVNVRAYLTALEELGEDETAEGLDAKITAAEDAYDALTEEEKNLEEVKVQKSEFDAFKAKRTAYNEAQTFAKQVEAINITATDAEDKITAAEEAYNALSAAAKEYAEDANAALATKKTELAAYIKGVEDAKTEFAALKTTIANFKASTELSDDGKNEAIIAAIANKGTYAENVMENTEIATLLTEINTADTDAKTAIETSLNNLKTSVKGAIAETTPSQNNYDGLTAEEEKIAALGAYAQSQFATVFEKSLDDVQEDLYNAKTTMWNTPSETIVSESTATSGTTRRLYLTVQFRNFKNELIEMKEVPEVTVTKDVTGDAANASVIQQLTKSATGEYVATIELYAFTDITSASYSIGNIVGAQEKPIDVTPTLGYNPYFTDDNGADGFKVAFDNEKMIFVIQNGFTTAHTDGKTYLEIYESGAITKDGDFLKFNGSPIVGTGDISRIDVSEWDADAKKIENLNRYLALNFGDYFIGQTRSVHFVIYGEATVEGKTSRTAIDAGTVSSARTFELTELDRYYTIPSTGSSNSVTKDGEDYKLYLTTVAVAGNMISDLNKILTDNGKSFQFTNADSLKTQFGIRITVKSGSEIVGVANLPMEENANTFGDVRFRWARAYFAEHPDAESVTFNNLTYTANYYALDAADEAVKDLFRQGATWTLNAPEALQTITLTTADRLIALKTTGKNNTVSDDNVWFTTVAVMGMMIEGTGEANGYSLNKMLTENGSTYQFATADDLKKDFGIRLTINGTLDGNAWEQILYLDLGKTYKFEDLVKLCSAVYYKAHPDVEENIAVSGLTFKACYCVREDANTDVKDLFKESAEWNVTGLSDSMELNRTCITLNAPAAIRLSNNGWVIMVRDSDNKFGGNGKLLTSGAAKYVKYEFYKKDNPNTKYTMYLFVNESNQVEFYKEINEDGTPKGEDFTLLTNTAAGDAGIPIGDFITNLKNAFAEEGIDFTGNWIFVDQYIVEGSNQYLYSTPNTTEFVITGNSMSVVTED